MFAEPRSWPVPPTVRGGKNTDTEREDMSTLELCAKLESLGAGDVATVFFKDGQVIRGGMLYNPLQQRGVIIDPMTETERRFEANEVAKIWRR